MVKVKVQLVDLNHVVARLSMEEDGTPWMELFLSEGAKVDISGYEELDSLRAAIGLLLDQAVDTPDHFRDGGT